VRGGRQDHGRGGMCGYDLEQGGDAVIEMHLDRDPLNQGQRDEREARTERPSELERHPGIKEQSNERPPQPQGPKVENASVQHDEAISSD